MNEKDGPSTLEKGARLTGLYADGKGAVRRLSGLLRRNPKKAAAGAAAAYFVHPTGSEPDIGDHEESTIAGERAIKPLYGRPDLAKAYVETEHKRGKGGKFAPVDTGSYVGMAAAAAATAGVVGLGALAATRGRAKVGGFIARGAEIAAAREMTDVRGSTFISPANLRGTTFRNLVDHAVDVVRNPVAVGKTPSGKQIRRQLMRDTLRRRERLIMVDKDSRVMLNTLGGATSVHPDESEFWRVAATGRVGRIIHNHPHVDAPPSLPDFQTGLATSTAAEMGGNPNLEDALEATIKSQKALREGSHDRAKALKDAVIYSFSGGRGGKLRIGRYQHSPFLTERFRDVMFDDDPPMNEYFNMVHEPLARTMRASGLTYRYNAVEKLAKAYVEAKHKRGVGGRFVEALASVPRPKVTFRRVGYVGVFGLGSVAAVKGYQKVRDFTERRAADHADIHFGDSRGGGVIGLRHLGGVTAGDLWQHSSDVLRNPVAVGKTPSRKEIRRQFMRDSIRSRERLIVTDKNGRVIVEQLGDAGSVEPDKKQSSIIMGHVLTGRLGRTFHNHPNMDSPPSESDFDAEKEIVAYAVAYQNERATRPRVQTKTAVMRALNGNYDRSLSQKNPVVYSFSGTEDGKLRVGAYQHAPVLPLKFIYSKEHKVFNEHGNPTHAGLVSASRAAGVTYRYNAVEKLAKAYTEAKHKRGSDGTFASKVGAAIDGAVYGDAGKGRDKPDTVRSSPLAGAFEGWNAVDAIGSITAMGVGAKLINRARFGGKSSGKGSHDRNLSAYELRQRGANRRAVMDGAAMGRAKEAPDIAAIHAVAHKTALDQGFTRDQAKAHADMVAGHVGDKVAGGHMRRLTAKLEALAGYAEHRVNVAQTTKLHGGRYLPALVTAAALGAVSAHRRSKEADGYDVSIPTHVAAYAGDALRVAGDVGLASILPGKLVSGARRVAATAGFGSPSLLQFAARHTGKIGGVLGTGAGLLGARTLLREQRQRGSKS